MHVAHAPGMQGSPNTIIHYMLQECKQIWRQACYFLQLQGGANVPGSMTDYVRASVQFGFCKTYICLQCAVSAASWLSRVAWGHNMVQLVGSPGIPSDVRQRFQWDNFSVWIPADNVRFRRRPVPKGWHMQGHCVVLLPSYMEFEHMGVL